MAADPKLVSVRLDSGLSYDAVPEVATAFTQARADMAAAQTRHDEALKGEKARADGLAAERDALKADVHKHEAALKQAREDGARDARSRLSLEAEAGKHGVEVRADMADRAVREAVVKKLAPETYNFDGKDDTYVAFAFDRETGLAAKSRENGGAARAVLNTGGAPPATRADAAAPARIRSSADLRRAFAAGLR